jgi:hypothetical protein
MFERLAKDAKVIPLPRDQQSFTDGLGSKRTSISSTSSLNGFVFTSGSGAEPNAIDPILPDFAERVEYFRRQSSTSAKSSTSQDLETDTTSSSLQITPNTAKDVAIDTVEALQQQALDLLQEREGNQVELDLEEQPKRDSQSTATTGKSTIIYFLN